MPKVSTYRYIPSFKSGKLHNFIVEGQGFSESDGAGGQKAIQADLEDPDKNYDWTKNPTVTFLDGRRIQIRAKATKRQAIHGGGIGELTITVTNGDGTAAAPVSQPVFYEESDEA